MTSSPSFLQLKEDWEQQKIYFSKHTNFPSSSWKRQGYGLILTSKTYALVTSAHTEVGFVPAD